MWGRRRDTEIGCTEMEKARVWKKAIGTGVELRLEVHKWKERNGVR